MEFYFSVNNMLIEQISKLDFTLLPPGFEGNARTVRAMQVSLSKVIDELGAHSAAAQKLNQAITTAEKLRASPGQILYLLKDATANNNEGGVFGFLKVGYKRLFLFDEENQVREVEPLCVLDFFIRSDHQRVGNGRRLFDHMLHDMEVRPHELAIDGPSDKMKQFLSKNYNMDRLLRQNNNFAVAPQFFDNCNDIRNKSGRSTPSVAPAVGRFAATQPRSAIASIIHGGASYYNEANNGNCLSSKYH